MIAALEGAPGVGKSTLSAALLSSGAFVVPEVNRLFWRTREQPAEWYLDRQNARWEMAACAARDGKLAVLDGDPLQPLWFGWLYPDEPWTSVETAATFFIDRVRHGRMRLPERYVLVTVNEAERARRLLYREMARGTDEDRARAKVERYRTFAAPQQRFFDALSSQFPGWIVVLDSAGEDSAGALTKLLTSPAPVAPDPVEALQFARDWLSTHRASDYSTPSS